MKSNTKEENLQKMPVLLQNCQICSAKLDANLTNVKSEIEKSQIPMESGRFQMETAWNLTNVKSNLEIASLKFKLPD